MDHLKAICENSTKRIKVLLCCTKLDECENKEKLKLAVINALRENIFLNIIGCIYTSSKLNYNIDKLLSIIAYEDSIGLHNLSKYKANKTIRDKLKAKISSTIFSL